MDTNTSNRPLPIEQTFQQALTHHQAGRLQEAGECYQTILQSQPDHPKANHHMGVLAVQMQQPAAALPYFMAALDADPACGQYWVSYIDALFQAGQPEDARQVLALARQQGLQGTEVEALVSRMGGGTQSTKESPTIATAAMQGNKKNFSSKPDKSPKKPASHQGKKPSHQETNTLTTLFNQGRYSEAANLALEITARFPEHEFGWKILGMAYKQMGQNSEALIAMQRAVALSPNDADAHCNLGVTLQDMGRLSEAEVINRRAIALNSGNAQAHSNLGITLQALGRMDEAEASFRRALRINPGYAKAYYNLGNLLYHMGKLDEAETNLRRALKIKPDYVKAHSNLGVTLHALGRLDEAEASYRLASKIDPNYAEAHYNLGNLLKDLERLNEAEASYRQALQINPDYAEAHSNLGVILQRLGRLDEALTCFRQQARLTPESGVAQHQIASLTGSNTECAPIQYVENVFDGYADKFDTHLLQVLNYVVPEKLVTLVTQHSTPPAEKWNVLDLGCGTGLVGSAIAPYAQRLVGVDLSGKMLEKARARNLYQRLVRLDLLTMMRGEKTSSYDVIIAADVFIYIGKIDEIIAEIKRLLRSGGIFAFSIETLEMPPDNKPGQDTQQNYRLENTGRYTHSIDYLTRLASINGFLIKNMIAAHLRTEQGKPVNGHLILWES